MKDYPRILTVQDISCLGQCSAAVALPILSACGCEAVILPTMVLSTHTGGLGEPVRRDLTADLEAICGHWQSQGITFDGILVGYLGKPEQIRLVREWIPRLLAPEGKLIVDPAMADHGKLYSGIQEAAVAEMRALCAMAHVILPNVTEACMLARQPYREALSIPEISALLQQLQSGSRAAVVLTGVAPDPEKTGAAVLEKGRVDFITHEKCPGSYHGTGDMFAAVLAGKWLRGESLQNAAAIAGRFVCEAIRETAKAPAHGYGVKFETVLPMLWE